MLGDPPMTLTILGTGNAVTTECYNTCFVLHESNQYFLVDGGGGSQILHQLKHAGIDWKKIKTIFVTHKHLDHITGIIWMIRMIKSWNHMLRRPLHHLFEMQLRRG